ncbi:uncharacterized protein ARMOST_11479 [Armillaria ostoyae]|uniref:Uncharacterized protein n=1 Tax=Armillaria ostoyae TaxID=47428 RepID=A0A284RH92_ARMOS|nr:uncharacterized protein ARMOST_11479 [Armillaria ostoyae]
MQTGTCCPIRQRLLHVHEVQPVGTETGYTFSVTKYRTRKLSKKPRGQGAHYYLELLVLKVNGRGLGRIGFALTFDFALDAY